jgi:hypothetical protein
MPHPSDRIKPVRARFAHVEIRLPLWCFYYRKLCIFALSARELADGRVRDPKDICRQSICNQPYPPPRGRRTLCSNVSLLPGLYFLL